MAKSDIVRNGEEFGTLKKKKNCSKSSVGSQKVAGSTSSIFQVLPAFELEPVLKIFSG